MSGDKENSKEGGYGGVDAMEVDSNLPPWLCQNGVVDSLAMRMMWIEIAKYLDGESLVKLASTCNWFYKVVTEECVWKYACLRDLDMPDPGNVSFNWKNIYESAFDGTHSYFFRQYEKHIDWMRIGAFFLKSPAALLTEKLTFPGRIEDTIKKMLESSGICKITNVKTGIWIADLQLLHCPVCGLNSCDGTMLVLDTRHLELFLSQGYQNGSWNFRQVGSHEIKGVVDVASGAIIDLEHLKDAATAEIFKTETWFGKDNDLLPKVKTTLHAAAVNSNKLVHNDGNKFCYLNDGLKSNCGDQNLSAPSVKAIFDAHLPQEPAIEQIHRQLLSQRINDTTIVR